MNQVGGGIKELGKIASSTNNDAIIMYVAIAISVVVILIVCISLYTINSKRSKERLAQYIQREDRILQVIEKNADSSTKVAEAIISLKTTLDANNRHCDVCKSEQMSTLGVIMNKQDHANMVITEVRTLLGKD